MATALSATLSAWRWYDFATAGFLALNGLAIGPLQATKTEETGG